MEASGFRAEVELRHGRIHGTSAQRIDLYSDKSDQVFSALRRVGWVNIPAIASVIFGNSSICLEEDFLSFPRPVLLQAPRNRNGPTPLDVVENVNGASRGAIAGLLFFLDLDIQEERKPPASCVATTALCNMPFDTAARDAMLANGCPLSVVVLWAPT